MKTEIHRVRECIRPLVGRMNKSGKAKSKLAAWIDKYDGKVVQFQVGKSAFHIVLTNESITFEEGAYSSPDVTMGTDSEFLTDILSGRSRPSSSHIAAGRLKVWGNFHDLVSFFNLLSYLAHEA